MDILYLVDRLENLIASSRKMPLVNQIMIKESDILNIVDQMRTSIPDEIKLARRIIQEKERIIAQSQADASTLLARAREESERAIKREGLLQAAGVRSQEMMREAEEHAERLKVDADVYVAETLRALRDHLGHIEMSVSRTILSIEKGLESLEQPLEEEDSVEGSFTEPEVASRFIVEEEGQPSAHPLPRRASLASDTMGGPGGSPPIYRGEFISDTGQSGQSLPGVPNSTPPPPLQEGGGLRKG